MTDHPATGLDDIVHQRVRLGILAIAHEARRVEFGFLRTVLELTAGNLGQHLSVLERAQLVHIEKGYEGRRPRTWVSLTPAGETALRDEIAHLKRLIRQVEHPTSVLSSPRTSP
jgi:DNA-binding MarR family transcriptional regulator